MNPVGGEFNAYPRK